MGYIVMKNAIEVGGGREGFRKSLRQSSVEQVWIPSEEALKDHV